MKGCIFSKFIMLFLVIKTLNALPHGFVYIEDIDKSIRVNLKYYTNDNFIGRRVPHYKANRGIMTRDTAIALSKAQKNFWQKDIQ